MRFLSEEWAHAVRDALNAHPRFTREIQGKDVRLQQVILTPDGEVRYWLRIRDGGVDLGLGDVPEPQATVTQDYDTAVALARSELSPVSAFMSGRLRVAGDLGTLMGLAGAFSILPEVMASLDVEY
ncbi:MAG TPA: SCP2 sterol-binding domain-containing protein [Actinomycetota bacterium]|nr:SCP2 sterol-binding domain-containing protein [Actinomycetota bacterium]